MTLKSGLQVIEDHSQWYHLKAWVRFSIRLPYYGCILHHFRDKARYWSKIVIFHTPLHSTPIRGFPLEYCYPILCEKNRKVWLPDGETTFMIYLAVSREYRRVIDRRTDKRMDGQTFCHGLPFLSFLYEMACVPSRTSAEAYITGWPNARPQWWDKCSVARHNQACLQCVLSVQMLCDLSLFERARERERERGLYKG